MIQTAPQLIGSEPQSTMLKRTSDWFSKLVGSKTDFPDQQMYSTLSANYPKYGKKKKHASEYTTYHFYNLYLIIGYYHYFILLKKCHNHKE